MPIAKVYSRLKFRNKVIILIILAIHPLFPLELQLNIICFYNFNFAAIYICLLKEMNMV